MAWFTRKKAGILTSTKEQIDVPVGQWVKCPVSGAIVNHREFVENLRVIPGSGYHFNLSSLDYFTAIFDDSVFELFDENIFSVDPLDFVDRKSYKNRLEMAQQKNQMCDAARSAVGTIGGYKISVAAMDFAFIGGSMGSAVGEIISRAIKRAVELHVPLLIISQSGGARMQEGALSLMQMAKTSAQLIRLSECGLPYISLMTNPTTGGVSASFAMLGDINLAEPGALIGFAGPRVIRETIGQDLPDNFQSAEYLQEKGFIDLVVDRRKLRNTLIQLLGHLLETPSGVC